MMVKDLYRCVICYLQPPFMKKRGEAFQQVNEFADEPTSYKVQLGQLFYCCYMCLTGSSDLTEHCNKNHTYMNHHKLKRLKYCLKGFDYGYQFI